MKERLIAIGEFLLGIVIIGGLLILLFWGCCSIMQYDEEQKQQRMIVKTYELIDKTTEVRTHRYLLIDNTIKTDHVLVWKSETGRILSCEAGRNSFYRYKKGKRYRFTIDPNYPEEFQLESACTN